MTFAQAVKSGIRSSFRLRGTASRSEFWYFTLFYFLVTLVTPVFDALLVPAAELNTDNLLGSLAAASPVTIVVIVLFIPAMFTISVRRVRDAGFSGWFVLPGWLASAAYLYFATSFIAKNGAEILEMSDLTTVSRLLEGDTDLLMGVGLSGLATFIGGVLLLVLLVRPTKLEGNRYVPGGVPGAENAAGGANDDELPRDWQPKL